MLHKLPGFAVLLGLAVIYLGERTFTGTASIVVNALGAALFLAGLAIAIIRWTQSQQERKAAALGLCLEYLGALVALFVYAAQTETVDLLPAGDARTVAMVLWPTILLLTLLPAIAKELALHGMAQAPRLETWRLRLAGRSARIAALGVVAFAGINYAASQWNKKVDLSYFKTTRAGTSTQAIVHNLTEDIKFTLFFTPGNDVLEHVRDYLEPLVAESPKATLEVVDHALVPDLARELKIRQNGYLVVRKGSHNESLRLGIELEGAQRNLKKLDSEIHLRLTKLLRPARVAYFTSGHLERDWSPPRDDKRPALNDLRTLVKNLGFEIKRLGMGEGLGNEIPKDATVVFIVGPLEPMLPSERESLLTYFRAGGRLFVLVDPEDGALESELLAELGVTVRRPLVAAGRKYQVRVQGRREAPYYWYTNSFASHPSVKTLGNRSQRVGVVLLGAGSLEKIAKPAPELKVATTLRAPSNSWVDENGNGRLESGSEKKASLDIAAAITYTPKPPPPPEPESEPEPEVEGEKKPEEPAKEPAQEAPEEGRAIVVADADALGNGVLRNPGNSFLLMDGVHWLAGQEQDIGTVESEEDVAIVHKKDEDTVWFYGTSFIMPAAVLAVGLVVSRRSRKRRAS